MARIHPQQSYYPVRYTTEMAIIWQYRRGVARGGLRGLKHAPFALGWSLGNATFNVSSPGPWGGPRHDFVNCSDLR